MWSANFVPKPKDWPPHVQVVGSLGVKQGEASKVDEQFGLLLAWLQQGPPPIFVGFGSMVIADTARLQETIKAAARASGVRVLVQSGWSKLRVADEPLCFEVGPCPHDWLLPKVAAVVHHGGAGTTAAGLKAAKPTLVCPFFGDQSFWGEMARRCGTPGPSSGPSPDPNPGPNLTLAPGPNPDPFPGPNQVRRSGAGCAPCPIAQLNVAILSASFSELMSAPLRAQATALAAQMAAEDGVGSALNHFLSSLPRHDLPCNPSSRRMPPHLHAPNPPPHAVRHDLLCDASLLLNPPEHKLALYRLRRRHAQLALQLVFGVATGLGIVAGSQCTNKTGLDGVLGFSRDLVDPTHWFYRSPGFWFRAFVCGWCVT